MMNTPSRRPSTALWICILGFSIWTLIVSVKYYTFQYTGWDLALSAQLMWNLCHGSLQTSLFGGNFLIDHANYIAFLLVPVYALCQSALTLLILKTFTFFAGAYILYLLAQKKVGALWGLGIMIGYIFYPANVAMLFFEFNFENLALPLILLSFYFLDEKKPIPFLVTCAILCLVKENMPPVVVMMGLYAAVLYRKDHPAISRGAGILLLGGAGLFLLHLGFIQPQLTQDLNFHRSNYWEFYKHLGDSPLEIIKNIFLSPNTTIALLFSGKNILFLAELFGPLLLPAILSPQILLLGAPLFLQHLLSGFSGQQSIYYYYASTLTVFVFLAAINTLGSLDAKERQRLLAVILTATAIFSLVYFPDWAARVPRKDPGRLAAQYQILKHIPPEAGIVSSIDYLPWLSQRKDLYPIGRTKISFTRTQEHIPEHVSFALFDPLSARSNSTAVRNFLNNKQWSVSRVAGELILLQKNLPNGKPLIHVKKEKDAPDKRNPQLKMGDFLELKSVVLPGSLPGGNTILPVEYFWKARQDLPLGFRARLQVLHKGMPVFKKDRYVAYGLPVKKDESVKEQAYYQMPDLPKGEYTIRVQITQDIALLLKNPQQESDTLTYKLEIR